MLETIVESINLLALEKGRVNVAIDGRCGAGKTTLAGKLKERLNCNVIHMDDFFLRPEQRKKKRYEMPGGNIDIERFEAEVVCPLLKGGSFSYRPFDCRTMSMQEPVAVEPTRVTVIEGTYSCHPRLWSSWDLHIFLNISSEKQRSVILARSGKAAEVFFNHWIPLEEIYFKTFEIEKNCDLKFEA